MQPHQQRVVDEKTELDAKFAKLEAFLGSPIYQTLSPDEQDQLRRQATAMSIYSNILHECIINFPVEVT
jgi:hypothetical protein